MAIPRTKELVQEGLRRKLMGQLRGAAEVWLEALRLEPNNERARAGLAELEAGGLDLTELRNAAPEPESPAVVGDAGLPEAEFPAPELISDEAAQGPSPRRSDPFARPGPPVPSDLTPSPFMLSPGVPLGPGFPGSDLTPSPFMLSPVVSQGPVSTGNEPAGAPPVEGRGGTYRPRTTARFGEDVQFPPAEGAGGMLPPAPTTCFGGERAGGKAGGPTESGGFAPAPTAPVADGLASNSTMVFGFDVHAESRAADRAIAGVGGGEAGRPSSPGSEGEGGRVLDDEADSGTLLLRAIDLLEIDDYAGAHRLGERVLALEPQNATAQELLCRCETTLTSMYESKLGGMERRPRVRMSPEELVWLKLDHREGFVLSLVDGQLSFEDLFSLSSMSRLETARILAKLVQAKVVESSQ